MLNLRAIRLAAAVAGACVATIVVAAPATPTIEKTVKVPAGGLYEVAFNSGNGDVYVAATGARGATPPAAAIVRLNGQTLSTVGQIDVTSAPLYGIAINSKTQTLYGTATRIGAMSIIDLPSGAVTTIKTPEGQPPAHLRQVVIDEQRNKTYASVVGGRGNTNPSQVWVIDGATKKLDRIINVDVVQLTGAALDARNNKLFLTGLTNNEVAVLDLATDKISQRFPSGGQGPVNAAFDAVGNRLFVTNQVGLGTLTVLNASTGAVLATVPTGAGALSVVFDAARNRIYVANRNAGTVTVVNGSNYSVIANLRVGTVPQTLALNTANGAIYGTNKARGGAAPDGTGQAASTAVSATRAGASIAAPAGTAATAVVAPVDETADAVVLIRP